MFCSVSCFEAIQANSQVQIRRIPVDSAWSQNSVNVVPFRKNSLVTWRDTQFIAFYNKRQHVVLGKRNLVSDRWELRETPFTGNTSDAHNSISIIADGEGFLHMSWDHHNNRLRYARGNAPGSLEMDTIPMTGENESSVTYPEFYNAANGNLIFLYRDGQSGRGNLVVNEYNTSEKKWHRLHANLIDGQGQRNAYWQAFADEKGTLHLSWVWRESPDVSSNHDMCYARSKDNGRTWEKLTGEKYTVPITASTAEYAFRIPPYSELINQTSMTADEKGNPYIATYWREQGSKVPQYQLIYANRKKWKHRELTFRTMAFSLSGMGTKSIPVSRPQIVAKGAGRKTNILMIFRDQERQSKASIARIRNPRKGNVHLVDLDESDVGSWEPSFDTELWKSKRTLSIFVQQVRQADLEGLVNTKPTMVYVIELIP